MSVVRLVRHENPEGRLTPLLLLASLRDIDPEIELVYFGGHDWRLGAVRPTSIREDSGRRILAQQASFGVNANPKSVMLGHLLTQGFAQIAMYRDTGDVSGEVIEVQSGARCTILEDFRQRDFAARHDREATFAAQLAESAGESQKRKGQADFMDAVHSDVRAHYAREMRGHTTFGHGGQTGGRGKLIALDAPDPDAPPLLTGELALEALGEIMQDLENSLT